MSAMPERVWPERFLSKVRYGVAQECHEWTAAIVYGYGRFTWNGKQMPAHRFAWEFANGPVPAGLFVLHRCDNRRCVRLDHLFLGTNQDNVNDMVSKGRSLKGSANGRAKLTEPDVSAIRNLHDSGISCAEIARNYGIDRKVVSGIVNGRKWTHV